MIANFLKKYLYNFTTFISSSQDVGIFIRSLPFYCFFTLEGLLFSIICPPEDSMLLKAFAKINWSLDITGVRPDGYHLMDMVMQPVSLADEIELLPAGDLSIFTDGKPASRADQSNLAYRAADLLRSRYSVREGVRILLHKRIPMGAGMGGGSADAAAVLRGLNRLWSLHLSDECLEELGLKLGADVPFCLRGGLVRTRGIGELLEKHPCSINYWLLVFQPCRALSTRDIFSAFHQAQPCFRPDTESVLRAFLSGDASLLSRSIGNVLEPVSASRCPEITEAVSALRAAGAFAAQMTGSGSAVFGAFRSHALAVKAASGLSGKYRDLFICHTQEDSIRIMEE